VFKDIDIDSQRNRRQQVIQALRDYFGERQVLNIATFSTEGSKSALLSAARGLGVDIDDSSYLASLIPSERGKTWNLHDCFFGNDDPDTNRKPIKELLNAVEQYPKLKETALKIEGTIKNRSIHASGVYIYNGDYTEFNAMMKSPKGQATTQYDMDDSNYMGNLKVDMLTVKNLDIIRSCMDMLIKDGYIDKQKTLRDTYNRYLHPDVLEYNDSDMWKKVGANTIPDLFQFDTPVGLECARKVKPTNVVELAAANSLMRLMAENGEQPVDKYIRHKRNPEEWIQEMKGYGLTDEEIKIAKKHLAEVYGVADSQESVMLLSMDKDISNFTIAESNKLRKGISKKKKKVIQEVKELFYKKGEANGS
jgi:DNA polymerase-3 subunit alpha